MSHYGCGTSSASRSRMLRQLLGISLVRQQLGTSATAQSDRCCDKDKIKRWVHLLWQILRPRCWLLALRLVAQAKVQQHQRTGQASPRVKPRRQAVQRNLQQRLLERCEQQDRAERCEREQNVINASARGSSIAAPACSELQRDAFRVSVGLMMARCCAY
jgi:hypothetical protein